MVVDRKPVDEQMIFALILGLGLCSADPDLARAIQQVLVSDRDGLILAKADQFAASLRKDFPDAGVSR